MELKNPRIRLISNFLDCPLKVILFIDDDIVILCCCCIVLGVNRYYILIGCDDPLQN